MTAEVIRLGHDDNVVVARAALRKGTALAAEELTLCEDIPAGHKVATRAIRKGEPVRKAGVVIGLAAADVQPGERIDAQRLGPPAAPADAAVETMQPEPLLPAAERARFQVIVREDGRVATRNYIGVFITVNCAATTARKIAEAFDEERLASYPNVDGVVAFVHELGCGMEMTGEPMELLRRTVAGNIRNPNVAAALLVGLGCERNNLYKLLEHEKLVPGPRLQTFVMQERGGTAATVEAGIAAIEAMLPLANAVKREPVSAEHLVVGLQSGAADAFAELSAYPALGVAVDLLIGNGGTAILSGTSDLHGVERALAARAARPEVAEKLARRIRWWSDYHKGRDTPMNGRVSAAQAAGGVATAVEKAVAAAKRWGRHPLVDVYEYAHPVTARGLVFMDTPAYEAVSATGQMAGGANLVCLVAGRGSGYGSVPAPALKLATNSATFARFADDLDLDCGPVLDGERTARQMGERIFAAMLATASGERTKAEALGVGESEFVPWPIGVFS